MVLIIVRAQSSRFCVNLIFGYVCSALAAGKLADLIVLDKSPLDDLKNSESIRYVMVNGSLFDADTMNEIGNYSRERSEFWFEQPGSQTNGSLGGRHTCTEMRCVCGH